jgi:hypothetical protein
MWTWGQGECVGGYDRSTGAVAVSHHEWNLAVCEFCVCSCPHEKMEHVIFMWIEVG